jgi:SAM-dependent methyltransferase
MINNPPEVKRDSPAESTTGPQHQKKNSSISSLLHRVYTALPKAPSTNIRVGGIQSDTKAFLKPGYIVLDIGAKDSEHQTRVPKDVRCITVDLIPSPGLDVAADAQCLPFPDACSDALFCVSVLPHCRNPQKVIQEFARVLRPGGRIYVSAAWLCRTVTDPYDYWRFSAGCLEILCQENFRTIENGYNRGPASCMADLLQYFGAILFCFGNPTLYSILLDVMKWFTWWVKYFDVFLAGHPQAGILSSGAFFYGERL